MKYKEKLKDEYPEEETVSEVDQKGVKDDPKKTEEAFSKGWSVNTFRACVDQFPPVNWVKSRLNLEEKKVMDNEFFMQFKRRF